MFESFREEKERLLKQFTAALSVDQMKDVYLRLQ